MSIEAYAKEYPILAQLKNPAGQVDLVETIGKGNYGYVYKGILKKTDEICAVKVVYLKEDEIKETLLEVEILRSCEHSNVTKFMGCYLKGLDLWICMELCNAGALDVINRQLKKPLTEEVISSLLFEALIGLDYLHSSLGLIHRDIKAGNMFLNENGELKIGDFGVSSPGANANSFIGTPYWMAPEVISTDSESLNFSGLSYNSKADIWSIGITAIELAEKNPPFSDIHPMRALLLIPTSELNLSKPKNYSKSFQEFVLRCLLKNPKKRPTAADLLKHPFLAKSLNLPRQKIIADFVQKSKLARDRRRAGFEDDEDEEVKGAVPVTAIYETMRIAKLAQVQFQTSSQPSSSGISSNAIYSEETDFAVFKDSLQNSSNSVLMPIQLGKLFKIEVNSADILDGRFVLLGLLEGLFFIDVSAAPNKRKPIPVIQGIRFKQINIIQDYNVLMALSGKNDHVRQYRLSSIRNLIQYLSGSSIAKINASSNECLHPLIQDRSRNEAEQVAQWTSDYMKIRNTKDAKQYVIQKTESSIFMGVLFKQDILLFEWAREPYSKFMKVKGFWLPEGPKFMSFLHDGTSVREVVLGYSTEANLVNVEDSKVKEVRVNKDFTQKAYGQHKARWQTFSQLPFVDSKKPAEISPEKFPTTNRRRSLVQTMGRKHVPIERYFLGTYHRHTRLVDITGQVVIGAGTGGWKDGVMWFEPPNELIQRPGEYIIGIGQHTIECIDWKTARTLQSLSVDESVSLRTLMDKAGITLVIAEKKKHGSVLFLIQERCSDVKFYAQKDDEVVRENTKSNGYNANKTSPGMLTKYNKSVEGSNTIANMESFTSVSDSADHGISYKGSSGQSLTRISLKKDSDIRTLNRTDAARKHLSKISEASRSFVRDLSSTELDASGIVPDIARPRLKSNLMTTLPREIPFDNQGIFVKENTRISGSSINVLSETQDEEPICMIQSVISQDSDVSSQAAREKNVS